MRVYKFKETKRKNIENEYACAFSRPQRICNQPKFSFGIRLPNGLAPSFPRPMASVSHSEVRCAVVTLCNARISNSRQKRAGKETPPPCSYTIQSKGKYAMRHRCNGDDSGVTGRLQGVREVICASPRFPRSVGADICKSSTNLQKENIEI
jgi:hypothetical protein